MLQDIANLLSRSRLSAKLGLFLVKAYSGCALNIIGSARRIFAYSWRPKYRTAWPTIVKKMREEEDVCRKDVDSVGGALLLESFRC